MNQALLAACCMQAGACIGIIGSAWRWAMADWSLRLSEMAVSPLLGLSGAIVGLLLGALMPAYATPAGWTAAGIGAAAWVLVAYVRAVNWDAVHDGWRRYRYARQRRGAA